jgi:hypothetical protein
MVKQINFVNNSYACDDITYTSSGSMGGKLTEGDRAKWWCSFLTIHGPILEFGVARCGVVTV